jgi:hypothetical protein
MRNRLAKGARGVVVACLLWGGGAGAQAPSAAGRSVAPGDAVITVNEFCPDEMRQGGTTCRIVITRAQFEKLAEALQPGMPLPLRLKVASSYARMMRMAAVAEQRALDKTAAFAEEMRFARLQLLSQDLTRVLQEEANAVSDAEIERYYKENLASYEQATLARIFIPRTGREKAADAGALSRLAGELRLRAVNGDDPDKLQTEAFAVAGMMGMQARTTMEKVRRNTLPPNHEGAMELQPGAVSEVISDPAGGHFIYKMIAKETVTLEDAQGEIREQIASQRYRRSMRRFEGDVVFNDDYFVPSGQQPAAPARRHRKNNGSSP